MAWALLMLMTTELITEITVDIIYFQVFKLLVTINENNGVHLKPRCPPEIFAVHVSSMYAWTYTKVVFILLKSFGLQEPAFKT